MTTRWGILGPGRIARTFARDLRLVPGAELAAVGSRSEARAAAFARELGFASAYGSYEALLADGSVDAVYVASPHALHVEHVTTALEAGKHVLCEKPITLRASDAEELFALAVARGRLLMEAMWTATHPVVLAVRQSLRDGAFGTPRHLHAELGFVVDAPPEDRLNDVALGAGALLDVGIYPLTFAHLLLGEAEELTATAVLSESGVDLGIAIAGRYQGGAVATMHGSMSSWSSRRADIATDRGRLVLEDFHHPSHATFTPTAVGGTNDDVDRGASVRFEGAVPVIGRGYAHEALEFQRCLAEGLLESPLVPHAQTLTIMRQMDGLRAMVGVRYAGDG
ncbi:MAG TPA: Gfo/Idh/MocA family oxidoreductase [Nocardioides sp.]|uniref:Gfo/Idh/MocA family protein n=1 Tax=Nocardioides sp. TaxID=35761 RepID=UPI002E3342E3|nr:Gfo/Idh/MocA family oxidoreductase [Nocardioides sp.]HEX5089388.1 Gfo/Idh/MocA family oxidoreductase [Nocardioides sp.]